MFFHCCSYLKKPLLFLFLIVLKGLSGGGHIYGEAAVLGKGSLLVKINDLDIGGVLGLVDVDGKSIITLIIVSCNIKSGYFRKKINFLLKYQKN